jgi:hypothetical protein
VEVPLDGVAAEVAVRYLSGAGVGRLRVRTASLADLARAVDPAVGVEVDPHIELREVDGLGVRDAAAGEVARGALVALRALRTALEPEAP